MSATTFNSRNGLGAGVIGRRTAARRARSRRASFVLDLDTPEYQIIATTSIKPSTVWSKSTSANRQPLSNPLQLNRARMGSGAAVRLQHSAVSPKAPLKRRCATSRSARRSVVRSASFRACAGISPRCKRTSRRAAACSTAPAPAPTRFPIRFLPRLPSVGAFGSARRNPPSRNRRPKILDAGLVERNQLSPMFLVYSSKEQHGSSRVVNCSSTIIWHHIAMSDEHHLILRQATENILSAVAPTRQHRSGLAGIAVIGFAVGMVHIPTRHRRGCRARVPGSRADPTGAKRARIIG